MQNKIYIGNNLLNSLDENTIRYKFIKLEYLESILKNNTLRIDKINSWEDVYENLFFKQRFLRNKEQVNTADLTE